MIDIHAHILPGLDDGPASLEDALAMIRIAAAAGTTDIVASPHANDRYAFNSEAVQAGIAELQAACGDVIRVHSGCEFHLSFCNIQDALRNPAKYTINGHGYVLVEFSDLSIPPNTIGILDALLSAGMVPIISHPERNPIIRANPGMLSGWVEHGCLVQVTAGSFLGRFGKAARRAAEELMARRLVHLIASDAHDTRSRTPSMSEAYTYIAEHYSAQHAEALFTGNARAVLLGHPIDIAEVENLPRTPRTRWHFGWR